MAPARRLPEEKRDEPERLASNLTAHSRFGRRKLCGVPVKRPMMASRRHSIEIIPAVGDATVLKTECLVLGVGSPLAGSSRRVDALSDGGLSQALQGGRLDAWAGATLLIERLPGVAATRILLVHLGDSEPVREENYQQALLAAARALADHAVADAVVTLAESRVFRRTLAWRVHQAGQVLSGGRRSHRNAGAGAGKMLRITLLIPRMLTLQLVEALRQGLGLAEGCNAEEPAAETRGM